MQGVQDSAAHSADQTKDCQGGKAGQHAQNKSHGMGKPMKDKAGHATTEACPPVDDKAKVDQAGHKVQQGVKETLNKAKDTETKNLK